MRVVIDNADLIWIGLKMAVIALAIGCVIGLVCAFIRASGNRWASIPVTIYVEIIRNIPLLLIVFLFYFGLPQAFPRGSTARDWTLRLLPDAERTFIVALAIYAGAYLTEIFTAGILSVGGRYLDAGRSLGLTRLELARYVTAPIMLRAVLPSLSNTFISLFKDTSIAVAIATPELTMAARKISTNYFRVIEAWLTAGALYLVTSYAIALSLRFLERRIKWSV
ncbi:MAG TPA: amino acid ABC transporter permease [Thermomicrobiales bacterium]|nr:amino acid ABC transporter permease [Thermomicrobiales bacterium]